MRNQNRDEGDEQADENMEDKFDTESEINTLNFNSEVLSSNTKNAVIKKFLKCYGEFLDLHYSEIEPHIICGAMFDNQNSKSSLSLSEFMDTENYFYTMELTEDVVDELEEALNKHRILNKTFFLEVVNECFRNNKIEALPIYIKLFYNSMDFNHLIRQKDLLTEGILVTSFYKGLYDTKFDTLNRQKLDEDEDLDDVNQNEPLLKKEFIEELQEVLTMRSKDIDAQNNTLYSELLGTTDVTSMEGCIGTYLKLKKFQYVSEIKSLLVLLEATQN